MALMAREAKSCLPKLPAHAGTRMMYGVQLSQKPGGRCTGPALGLYDETAH
jgi:hypothetical protein